MDIILEKDGKQFTYKTGSALYLLLAFIPIVGALIALILIIMRKQFRGITLNQLVIGLIFGAISFGISLTGSTFLVEVCYTLTLAFSIYMTVMYVLNANYYSIKQRLDEGYHVVNNGEFEVQAAVERAKTIKKPFWQITRF